MKVLQVRLPSNTLLRTIFIAVVIDKQPETSSSINIKLSGKSCRDNENLCVSFP